MHNRFIRLVLEVAIPARTELLHVILFQLLLIRSHFDASFNTIGGERPSTVDIPLVKDTFLNLGIATHKIIEAFCIRLGTIGGEREVMVLEVETDTWQIDLALDAGFLEFLGVSDTRSLQYEWCAEGSAGNDDLLASSDDGFLLLARMQGFHWNGTDGGGTAVLQDYLVNFRVAHEVEIAVVSA